MAIEYKTVGAPHRGRRKRGAKTRSDKVAAAMSEVLDREAVDGWQYLRTDLIPIEERRGWFGRTQEVHRAVMVFERDTEAGKAAPSAYAETARPMAAPTSGDVEVKRPPLSAVTDEPPSGSEPLVAAPPLRTVPEQDAKG